MNKTDPKITALLKNPQWQDERKQLRNILLDCKLDEAVKWGKLCYRYKGNNVVLIFGQKHYCALGFLKGALLKDPKGLLHKPGAHSQAMRQLRFTGLEEILKKTATIKAIVREAIKLEDAGLTVDFKEKDELVYPQELKDRLNKSAKLQTAFASLTPGRQRGYVLHVSAAKQAGTRASRVEKCIPRILAGKGLNDR